MHSIVQINSKYTSALMYLSTNDNTKSFAGFSFPVVRDDTNVFFEAKMAVKAENQSQSWETRLWRDAQNKEITKEERNIWFDVKQYLQGLDDGE